MLKMVKERGVFSPGSTGALFQVLQSGRALLKICVYVVLLAIVLATKKEWIVSKDSFNFIYIQATLKLD